MKTIDKLIQKLRKLRRRLTSPRRLLKKALPFYFDSYRWGTKYSDRMLKEIAACRLRVCSTTFKALHDGKVEDDDEEDDEEEEEETKVHPLEEFEGRGGRSAHRGPAAFGRVEGVDTKIVDRVRKSLAASIVLNEDLDHQVEALRCRQAQFELFQRWDLRGRILQVWYTFLTYHPIWTPLPASVESRHFSRVVLMTTPVLCAQAASAWFYATNQIVVSADNPDECRTKPAWINFVAVSVFNTVLAAVPQKLLKMLEFKKSVIDQKQGTFKVILKVLLFSSFGLALISFYWFYIAGFIANIDEPSAQAFMFFSFIASVASFVFVNPLITAVTKVLRMVYAQHVTSEEEEETDDEDDKEEDSEEIDGPLANLVFGGHQNAPSRAAAPQDEVRLFVRPDSNFDSVLPGRIAGGPFVNPNVQEVIILPELLELEDLY